MVTKSERWLCWRELVYVVGNKCFFLPARWVQSAQPAGPKNVLLCFLHLFVCASAIYHAHKVHHVIVAMYGQLNGFFEY